VDLSGMEGEIDPIECLDAWKPFRQPSDFKKLRLFSRWLHYILARHAQNRRSPARSSWQQAEPACCHLAL
jgi:hypothetical protein